MSKTCKECGCQMDDNAQACPQCGCPAENASASVYMDANVLNEGKSTEAESTISNYAESILKWGNVLSILLPVLCIIKTIVGCCFLRDSVSMVITICSGIFSAILCYFLAKFIAKLTWASIMLFVNISTTLKRIEIKLDENGTN
jgi:uncharacterized membrane protein YvbJ